MLTHVSLTVLSWIALAAVAVLVAVVAFTYLVIRSVLTIVRGLRAGMRRVRRPAPALAA